MEIILFCVVFGLVTLTLLGASLALPPSPGRNKKPGFLSMPDLPEGEMHLAELLLLSSVLGLLAVVTAAAMSQ